MSATSERWRWFFAHIFQMTLHYRFTSSITYHDALHGFRAGRGTGTTTLEANMLQQLAAMREEVLDVIFLDLTKAYDALDRSRCLEILEGYCVGPNARRLLKTYWRRLTMVARAGGYYGKDFKGEREAWCRATRCPQPYLMWWWTRSSGIGWTD